MQESDVLHQVCELLASELGSHKLFIFGSRATGKANEFSDFDLLVDAGKPIEENVMKRIRQRIEKLNTLYKVDIVDAKVADETFLRTIRGDLKRVVNGRIET
ncbi:MAG: nucleotidyltransferase family protein [Bdellovibrionales bacterium]